MGYHPYGHEPGSRRDAGYPEPSVAAGDARTSRAVLLGARAWPRIGVVRGGIPRGNNLVAAGELLMIDVNPRVDDGDGDAFALGNGVSGLHVSACTDALVIERGRL